MSAAPARICVVFMPSSAAGSMPTGVSTLNRPPTLGGMSRAGTPSRRAMSRSAPFSGSVTNTRCSRAAFPNRSLRTPRTIRYCAMVSAVPPDFEMTMNSVRSSTSRARRSAMVPGSTLSSTWKRGLLLRPFLVSVFQSRLLRAVCSAIGPSAEPPMPSSTTSSNLPRVCLANSRDWSCSARSRGRSRKPRAPVSRNRLTAACVVRKSRCAASQASAGMPPDTAPASMFV